MWSVGGTVSRRSLVLAMQYNYIYPSYYLTANLLSSVYLSYYILPILCRYVTQASQTVAGPPTRPPAYSPLIKCNHGWGADDTVDTQAPAHRYKIFGSWSLKNI